MSRPSDYSPELAADICAQLAEGKPLTVICKDEAMPGQSTVYLWLLKHPEFVEMYVRAREDQAETLADEIVAIADEDPAIVERADGDSVSVLVDGSAIQRQRLRIDARKWVAAKLKPKKYGDKVDVDHGGTVTVEVRKCG